VRDRLKEQFTGLGEPLIVEELRAESDVKRARVSLRRPLNFAYLGALLAAAGNDVQAR
jgi:hypothetical protein